MAFGLRKPNVSPIAVDFGVSSLKAIQIEPGNHPKLVAAACLETPYHLLHDDDQRLQFQCDAIPKLLRGSGFTGRRAVCSVSSLRTLVQSVQVQRTQGVPTLDLVNQQIKQITNRDPRTLILRQYEVCEVNRSGQKRTEVICLAMPRDLVITHMKALRSAKLDPVGIHCEHIAMLRSFVALAGRKADNATLSLYLDLGYGSTNVAIARGDTPLLAKTIHLAGRTLDHELAQAWGCPVLEARDRRLAGAEQELSADNNGAPSSDQAETGSAGTTTVAVPATDTTLATLSAAHVDSLTEEIRMAMRYFAALFPSDKIERIIFMGGEARNLDLCKGIARALRLPAQIADPLTPLEHPKSEKRTSGVDLGVPQPGWAVPLGLCAAQTDL